MWDRFGCWLALDSRLNVTQLWVGVQDGDEDDDGDYDEDEEVKLNVEFIQYI